MERLDARLRNLLRALEKVESRVFKDLSQEEQHFFRIKQLQNEVNPREALEAQFRSTETMVFQEIGLTLQHLRNAISELERPRSFSPNLALRKFRETA